MGTVKGPESPRLVQMQQKHKDLALWCLGPRQEDSRISSSTLTVGAASKITSIMAPSSQHSYSIIYRQSIPETDIKQLC